MANKHKTEIRMEVLKLRAKGLTMQAISDHFLKKGIKISVQLVAYYSKVKEKNEK